jgi:uncharacterized repeat protein (TIGR03943 family)
VTDEGAAGIVAVLGVLNLKLVTSGRFVDYVRPRMGPPLMGAAMVLVAAGASGLFGLVPSRRRRRANATPPLPLERRVGPAASAVERAGLAVVIPIVLLATVPVAPLGAFAAGLRSGSGRAPPSPSLFAPLARPVRGAVELSVSDFVSRALYDPGASLRGVTVRLVGFAAPDPRAPTGSFDLVRFAIYCCAADAIALRVRVHLPRSLGRPPGVDTWLEVTGLWHQAPPIAPGAFDPSILPVLDARSIHAIAVPANPYDATV